MAPNRKGLVGPSLVELSLKTTARRRNFTPPSSTAGSTKACRASRNASDDDAEELGRPVRLPEGPHPDGNIKPRAICIRSMARLPSDARHSLAVRAVVLMAALSLAGAACVHPASRRQQLTAMALRVCADPSNLPLSNDKGEGYENKIAEALAHDLKLRVEYTYFPQRMGFVRNTLRARDELTQQFKCDLIIGVPKDYELTATTQPYMHSTYALIFSSRSDLAGLRTADDLLKLPRDKLAAKLRIGVFTEIARADWLLRIRHDGSGDRGIFDSHQNGDVRGIAGACTIGRDLWIAARSTRASLVGPGRRNVLVEQRDEGAEVARRAVRTRSQDQVRLSDLDGPAHRREGMEEHARIPGLPGMRPQIELDIDELSQDSAASMTTGHVQFQCHQRWQRL